MKRRQAAKKNKNPQQTEPVNNSEAPASAPPSSEMVTLPKSVLDDVLGRLRKVESQQEPHSTVNADDLQFGASGETVGMKTLHSVDPKDYEDPTDKLAHEEKLRAFGFLENFILQWKVVAMSYKTIIGITQREPRFEIILYMRLYDEFREPLKNKDGQVQLMIVKRGYFFEDREEVERVSADLGLTAATSDIYSQVRYERILRWIVDIF